ncbi:alpha/beta fold hydrolase [Dactylosporangium sp. NPDC050688]|uniref:thioesterase II family protein n=1 Tax=Dactylosporangium sp. NPDC050688 TaxID=3157217 RepID=UPI0033DCDDFA
MTVDTPRLAAAPLRPRTPAVLRPRPVDAPVLRLVGFPHAGGSAAGYHPLGRLLPPDWDLLLLDLPGRGQRHAQPSLRSMAEVLLCALSDLRPWLDGTPLALFGHSYGAVLAYEVALTLQDLGHPPVWLGVSGRVAPGATAGGLARLYELDDRRLTDQLVALGGLPPALAEVPELLERFLGPVRDDLRVLDSYRPRPSRPRLSCPITALCGTADPLAPAAGLPAWQDETTARFRLRMFPGGHFYLLGDGLPGFAAAITADTDAAVIADVGGPGG